MFLLHLSLELSVEAARRKQTSRRKDLCLALFVYSDGSVFLYSCEVNARAGIAYRYSDQATGWMITV